MNKIIVHLVFFALLSNLYPVRASEKDKVEDNGKRLAEELFSKSHLSSSQEEEVYHNFSSRIVTKERNGKLQPLVVSLVSIEEDTRKNNKVLTMGKPSRSKESTTILKIHKQKIGLAKLVLDSYDPSNIIAKIKQSKGWDVANGLPPNKGEAKNVDWLHCSQGITLGVNDPYKFPPLIEACGSSSISGDDLQFDGYVWPLDNLVLTPRSSHHECPIKRISLTPANNQFPMQIVGRIMFFSDPYIELEVVNIGNMELELYYPPDFVRYLTKECESVVKEEEYGGMSHDESDVYKYVSHEKLDPEFTKKLSFMYLLKIQMDAEINVDSSIMSSEELSSIDNSEDGNF